MRHPNLSLAVWGATLIAAVPVAAGYAKLDAGMYGNTKYQVVTRDAWTDGTGMKVVVSADAIETVNCSGCDVTSFHPGYLFRARNLDKAPMCFAFPFTMIDNDRYWGNQIWGNGQTFLLKGKQKLEKFAGITRSFSWKGSVDLRFNGKLQTWRPASKNDCGPNPFV